jgi:hypothetical protein
MNQKHPNAKTPAERWKFILTTGLFAGLIWGGFDVLAYYLGFTKILPGVEWKPFFTPEFLEGWAGHFMGILGDIILSLVAASLYAMLLLRFLGAWISIAYGAAWGALAYGLVGPALQLTPPIWRIDMNSLVTELSNFILWGLFIGYTLVIEFNDEQGREGLV